MATPKRITKKQGEANKKKQQVLRQAGYNIKIDGSWGPWQEAQYKKILPREKAEKAKKIMSKQTNVGVMALPVGGAGAVQLLRGLGSISLPSIAIPTLSELAMATPGALTVGSLASDIYNRATGKFPKIPALTPQERQAQVFTPDATRVSRPIVLDFPRQVKSVPIGERYINPVLSREATRSRHLATTDEAVRDSSNTLSVDTGRVAAPSTPPSPKPKNNEDKKNDKKENSNSWFKLWEGSGTSSTPKYPNFWRYLRNFGIRVPLYTGVAAPAVDVAGNMVSASREPEGQVHQWKWPLTSTRFSFERGAWKLFGDAYSTPVDSTKAEQPQAIMQSQQPSNSPQTVAPTIVTAPKDTINPEVQDSIIKAFFSR